MKNAIKWPVAAAGALLVAIAAYVAVNSVDCELPDMSKFDNRFVVPSDADNVYCGLVAVTNVVSEKTGRPILASLFDVSNGRGPIQRFHNEPLTDADKDAILAESSKALSLYHEAVRRKAWWSCDPAGKREPFPHVDAFWRLCVLVHLEAQRRLELGETSAAIDDVGDMLLLARKIENDAESDVRWLTTRLLVEKAGDIAMKIAKSEKSTDADLVRLQAAMAQYDVASRPERAQRMLNNELAVYFAWLCDPAHSLDPDDLSDDGEFSHLMLHVPFLSHYFYHRNRTLSLCAGNIEKMKQGLRSGYDKAAWEKAYGEMFNGLGVGRFSPNFSGSRLVAYNLQSSGLIKDFQNGSKWYDAVESAVAEAMLRRKEGTSALGAAENSTRFRRTD